MVVIIKFVVKDFNPDRLDNELEDQSLRPDGMKWAGFDRINNRLAEPFTERRVISTSTGQPDQFGEPGELHFRYPIALTSGQEANLDQLLADHDATLLSRSQTNNKTDEDAIAPLINAYKNWGTQTPAEKDNVLRQLARIVARILDSSQDV